MKEQLIQQLRSKYPEYNYLDDETLYNTFTDNNPEYSNVKQDNVKQHYFDAENDVELYSPEPGMFDFVKKGYNESLTGMAYKVATGDSMFDLSDRDYNTLENIGSQVVSLFLTPDVLTFMIPGSAAAKIALGGIKKKTASKVLLNLGAKAETKEGVQLANKIADRAVNMYVKNNIPSMTATAASSSAAGFATYDASAEFLTQKLEDIDKGEMSPGLEGLVTPFGIDWGKVAVEGGKGLVKGSAVGSVAAPMKVLNKTQKSILTGNIAQTTTETTALLGASAALGEDINKETIIETFGTIAGLKMAHGAKSKVQPKLRNALYENDRVKNAYLKLLKKGNLDSETNKMVLNKIREYDVDNKLIKSELDVLEKSISDGKLTSSKSPSSESLAPKRDPKTGRFLKLSKDEKSKRDKLIGENKSETLEHDLGIKTEISNQARRLFGIKDGNLKNGTKSQLYDYQKWLKKNIQSTLNEKLTDSKIRQHIVDKIAKDGVTGLPRYIRGLLPAALVVSRFGGGPGQVIGEKIRNHFFDQMGYNGFASRFAREFKLSRKELHNLYMRDKSMVEWDKLNKAERQWYTDIHGFGVEGEPGYKSPNVNSKAYKSNVKFKEMTDAYFREWKDLVLDPVKDKQSRKKLEKILDEKYVTDYFMRSLTPEARKWIIAEKGDARGQIVDEVMRQMRKQNEKREKRDKLSDDHIRAEAESFINDLVNFNSTNIRIFNPNFDLQRSIKLPNYITHEGKEIKVLDTSYGAVSNYTHRISQYLASIKHFRDYTNVNTFYKRAGVTPPVDKSYAGNHLGYLKSADREIGDYAEQSILRTTKGLKEVRNDSYYRAIRNITSLSAWTGLSSPFSGMKNFLLADVHNFTAYGFKGLLRGYLGLFNPSMWKATRESGAFEVGGHIWEDAGMSKWNPGLMSITEDANRLKSVSAGLYASKQAISRLRGESTFLSMSNDYATHLMKNVFGLNSREYRTAVDYGLDPTSGHAIKSGKSKSITNINKKIVHYSHINTQGATSPAFLPLWASNNMTRPLTLFYRMAYRANVNFVSNVVKPFEKGNPFPLMRYMGGSLLVGNAMWSFYESALGMISPHKASKEDYKQLWDYAYRAEILGGMTNGISPYDNSFVESYTPVIINNIENFTTKVGEVMTGKKRMGKGVSEFIEETVVFVNHAKKLWRNKISKKPEYKHIINHKNIRTVVSTYAKEREPGAWEKTKEMRYELTQRSPYLRDLKDAFFAGDRKDMGKTYWAAIHFIADEYMKANNYMGNTETKYYYAYLDAEKALRRTIKLLRPVDLSLDYKSGRLSRSKYDEFMIHMYKNNEEMYNTIQEAERYFIYRATQMEAAINQYDYLGRFSTFIKKYKPNSR